MEISFETKGITFFQHETAVCFSIDGSEYWFTMIENGSSEDCPGGTNVEFVPDEDLSFDLTEEMKTEMHSLVWEAL